MEFTSSKFETGLIASIVDRIFIELPFLRGSTSKLNLMMDIEAVHGNGTPLNLNQLATCRREDFIHDITGIHNNVNRETGKLENCFSPRCSLRGIK